MTQSKKQIREPRKQIRKPRKKLTKRSVDAIKADGKDQIYFDEELSGFGVRVKPSGRKSWLIQYRNQTGRTRRLTIGAVGRLTPDEARAEARRRLAAVDTGRDPSQERRNRLHADTVADLAKWYLERYVKGLTPHRKKPKKPTSIRDDSQRMRDYVLPALGSRKVAAIESLDIERLHASLKDRPYLANRLLALLSRMFTLAESRKLRKPHSNPCWGVERYEEESRKRYLKTDELVRLGEVLAKAEESGPESPWIVAAIRLLLLTGCRRNEILELQWDDVDLEEGILTLPDSKTGSKDVILGAPAREVLSGLKRVAGNPHVIVGNRRGRRLADLRTPWKRILERAEIKDVRLHDLRHSFASIGVGGGLSLALIGALLGHTQASTTQRYAHAADDPLRQAADQISGEIDAAMKKKSGDVLKFGGDT